MEDKIEILNNENNLEKYEQFIIERDALLKECDSLEIKFQQEFGEEILNNFKEEVECIKLKKIITFIQSKKNKGEELDPEELNASILIEMQYYNHQINEKLEHLNNCKESKTISAFEANEVKKIYKNVVKLIHPDVSSIIDENEEINDLWNKIYKCYRANDLNGIREANYKLKKLLDKLGIANNIEVDLTGLDEKIEMLQQEIVEIQNSVTYLYKDWIYDDEKIKKKHDEYKAEFEKYQQYKEELTQAIENLKKG